MFFEGFAEARASVLVGSFFDARAELGVGGRFRKSFDGERRIAVFALDEADEPGEGLRPARESDGAEKNAAEPRVGGGLVALREKGGERGGAVRFGQGEGGFGGSAVAGGEKSRDERDPAFAMDFEQSMKAHGEDFRVFAGQKRAQTEHGDGEVGELADGADGLDAHAFVFVGKEIEKEQEELVGSEAVTGDEGMGAVGADGRGRVGAPTPGWFQLAEVEAAQKHILVAAFEAGKRAAESVFGPALRVGFLRMNEEAVEGRAQIGNEIGELVFLGEARGFGNEEVAFVGKRFANECDGGGVEFAALEGVERFHLFVKAVMGQGRPAR